MFAKFRRVDGVEFEVDESSASFELMTMDGAFERADIEPSADESADTAVDLGKLSKKQLFEEAAKRGVPVTEEMAKAEIIAAIEVRSATSSGGE